MERTTDQRPGMKMMAIPVNNLGCGEGRASLAERRLAREPGVVGVYANPATEALYIKYDPALTSRALLVEAIEQLGLGRPDGASQSA